MQSTTEPANVPDDFPHEATSGIVIGAKSKFCAALVEGKYLAGRTTIGSEERWSIYEDFAHQFVPQARNSS